MIKITVKQMTTEDVEEVFQIEKLIHPNHHWSKNSFYNELSNKLASYWVIKDENNKILAFIGAWIIFEEAHITTLGTHPDFRRLHLAQILILKIIEVCYKLMVKYITLEVRESNIAAISLYQKFLFESIGQRKNYYQDNGENAIIMFTQNIWYDTFKNNYNKLKEISNKAEIIYDE